MEKKQPSQSAFHHIIVQQTAKHKHEEGWQRAPARDRIPPMVTTARIGMQMYLLCKTGTLAIGYPHGLGTNPAYPCAL